MGAPTNEEQLLLELVNEARINPDANAARYITSYSPLTSSDADIQSALNFFSVNGAILQAAFDALVPVAPLAWNNQLADAAQSHSGAMITAQTQSHQVPGELALGPRLTAAGYAYISGGENIYAFSDSVIYGHAGLMVDWGGSNGGMQDPPGHRNNIMSSTFTEIGIDITHEDTGGNPLGPLVITQDLGTRGLAFVLGVAYTDTDHNNFYSIGEGRADLSISVGGGGSTTSTSSGGYQVQVSKASLTVTLTGGGLASAATVSVSTAAGNVKLDVVDGNTLLVSNSVTVTGSSITTVKASTANGISITTGTGSQTLIGGAGIDSLSGGAGDDTYQVQSQTDLVFENASQGTDTVLSTANFYLYANIENLTLAAGAGDIFGVGNALANTITGNTGANLLLGGDNNDTINGGAGGDQLYGEAGADTLNGDAGVDYLIGGIGNDILNGGTEADALYGEDGDDTLNGGAGFFTDILSAGAGDDTLYGNSGLNEQDYLDGNAGNDTYYVDTTYDLTFEVAGGGIDTVYADVSNVPNAGVYLWGEVENLTLVGATAYGVGNGLANVMTGSSSGNWLLGGAGNDTLNGKGGGDVLFGEAGADIFVFEQGTGGDVIGDFNAVEDQINLDAYNFASFAQLQTAFVQNGAHGAINLGGGDFLVLHNVTMATLNAGDFIL